MNQDYEERNKMQQNGLLVSGARRTKEGFGGEVGGGESW